MLFLGLQHQEEKKNAYVCNGKIQRIRMKRRECKNHADVFLVHIEGTVRDIMRGLSFSQQ
jgi:hypothetical protein